MFGDALLLRCLLLLSLAASGEPASVACTAPPQRVFLGAVATNLDFAEQVFETCGLVQRVGDRDPRERVLYDVSPRTGDHYWINVFDGDRVLPPEGTRTCVTGIFRRRDGYSIKEARALGRSTTAVADGLQLPDFVFYPVRCPQDAPARG